MSHFVPFAIILLTATPGEGVGGEWGVRVFDCQRAEVEPGRGILATGAPDVRLLYGWYALGSRGNAALAQKRMNRASEAEGTNATVFYGDQATAHLLGGTLVQLTAILEELKKLPQR